MEQKGTAERTSPGRKRVGCYILGDTIGEGSFAKVRVGTHIVAQERVAIKIIDKRLIANRDYVKKNLRREADMMRKLNHANISKLYEVLETQNNYYLVMELAEGGEFMRYLCDRRRLSERETRRFMRQLVSAVEYMHQEELVHRDIKIENFLLDSNNDLKVIDFGLSNVLGPDGFLRTQCGSPAYAAPEIFSSTGYGTAVDAWSIGVNMFAMLTGELPFNVDPPNNMCKLHAKIIEGCVFPDFLTKDCKDLLSRLLTVDETSRIKLSEVLKHSWMNRGHSKRLMACSYDNLIADNLNMDAISYMSELGYSAKEVIENVLQNRPVPANAVYHLLVRRLEKGCGFPDEVMAHVQSDVDREGAITDMSYRSTKHPDNAMIKDTSLESTIGNKNNSRPITCGRSYIIDTPTESGASQTQHHNGRTSKLKPSQDDVDHISDSLKEIDLKNNEINCFNNMISRNQENKTDKLRSVIKTQTLRKKYDHSSLTCAQTQQRQLSAIKEYKVQSGTAEISETFTESKKHQTRTPSDSFLQKTYKAVRPPLRRSISHTLGCNIAVQPHQNDNCCVNNGRIVVGLESVTNHRKCRPTQCKKRAETVPSKDSFNRAIPKERLRRSNTDPSIYSFPQRPRHQEYLAEPSYVHRKELSVQKLDICSQNPQPSSRTISGALFGFPTRLRSSSRKLMKQKRTQEHGLSRTTNMQSATKYIGSRPRREDTTGLPSLKHKDTDFR
ncbi:uncharacterized protein [Antedon mediterranea]|uniref:uncharacterized protein n=1 Tax=Antedon mediterranea TaxID=105859 RepID=UPI003AF7F7E4